MKLLIKTQKAKKKKKKKKKNPVDNYFHNILRLFDVLSNFKNFIRKKK